MVIETCMIDVGAHWGELSLPYALAHPDMPVFAFEPDPRAYRRLCFTLANYHPFLMMVGEQDGFEPFHIYQVPGTSSALRLDYMALVNWPGGQNFAAWGTILSPVIRLDTFMDHLAIQAVDWLKVDTQGYDLRVLQSLGDRIADVRRVTVEAPAQHISTYLDAPDYDDLDAYLRAHRFTLVEQDVQTCGYEVNLTYER